MVDRRKREADSSSLVKVSSVLVLCLAGLFATTLSVVAQDTDATGAATEAEDASASPGKPGPCKENRKDCGCGEGGKLQQGPSQSGMGRGCGGDHKAGQAGSHRGQEGRPEARLIHFLIDNHDRLERSVERIPLGVRTRTTTDDPDLVEPLRQHVRQMWSLIEDGGRIRNWDPLFREIFERRDAIEMEITDIDGGVEIVETSEDAEVVKLIQAHAAKVDDFVARGPEAYQESTPLPEGYSDSSP